MAHAKIYFENPHTGQVREAPVGFSWTVFSLISSLRCFAGIGQVLRYYYLQQ